jgi:biopolymer transport protein ExbD
VHHVSARKRRGRPPAKISINLSTMIDVIFNLLVYFVVTANFAVDEGVLTLKLPQGSGTPQEALAPPDRPLEITIQSIQTATGPGAVISLPPRTFTSFSDLSAHLTAVQFSDRNPSGVFRADNPVIIRPDGEVRWQYVVDAFNAAVAARYTNVSFGQAQTAR